MEKLSCDNPSTAWQLLNAKNPKSLGASSAEISMTLEE